MSLADTRPPWLTAPEDLENLVSESGMQVYVNDLRKSRHGCSIVDNVLTLILQHHLPGSSVPSEFELNIARQHLAVELQNMFRRWSEEGLKATLEGSFLKQFYPMAMDSTPTMGRKDLDLQIRDFRPVNSPSSSVTMDTVSGQQMSTYLSGPTSVVIPMKRSMEDDEMTPNKAGKFYYTAEIPGEKDFRCPYNVRDPTSHPECAGKRFPNPRKLKEHIWRFTKPFKCPNCFEGFGRDKTKAIHCDQRKVKCVTAETNDYEGSAEQQRDKAIERAKNTPEILLIFEQYDRSISSPCQ
ncbi:hypothetical protein K440DRAFT_376764 [Wilcoxina mikolae CBS 423.85]|nr:hypothetical protein K440DRAFT_376764 [Wilcoxina mikolae CBS 423.85]